MEGQGKGKCWQGRGSNYLYVTHCIKLIHTALNFHLDIPYGYLVMACTRTDLGIYQRDVTPENKKTIVGTNI